MTAPAASVMPSRLALVRIGRYELAVDAALIREVVRGPITLTPFPRSAAHVLGAFAYRGRSLPMIDVDALLAGFGGAAPDPRPAAFAMVLDLQGRLFAIQIDVVGDLVTPTPDQLSAVDIQSPQGAGVFSQLYAPGGGAPVAVILDLAAVLTIGDLHSALHQDERDDDALAHASAVRPLVIVRAGEAQLAFEATAVRQVQRRAAGMAFQMQHPSLRGFHTFRGETLAVIDLLALLDLPPSESPSAGSHLLIVGYDASDSVALVVDEIVTMEPLSLLELQALSPDAVRQPALYAGTLVSRNHGITLVLEANALLEAARIVDHRLFVRAANGATAESARQGAARALFIVYAAGGGILASTLGALDSIIEFPDEFVDLRQPGTPLVGLCDRHGTSVQVLDLGVMMGRPPLESVRRRPVLVIAGARGLEGFMVDRLAFLQEAVPVPLPGRNRGTIGLIAAPTEMIRAQRGDIDVSATVLPLQSLTGVAAAA